MKGAEERAGCEVADRVQCRGTSTGTGMMDRLPDMDLDEVKRIMEAQMRKLREFEMQRRRA